MRERGVTEEGGAVDRGAMGRVGEERVVECTEVCIICDGGRGGCAGRHYSLSVLRHFCVERE